MRKKVLVILGVVAVMAVVLSVTAFAADGSSAQLTDYGVISVMFEKLTLTINAVFKTVDAIYIFFRDLFV